MLENFKQYLHSYLEFSPLLFEKLSASIRYRSYRKGEFLLKAGESHSSAFFVESGLLRMYSIDETSKEHLVQFACENWIVSDRSSAVFNEPSDFYIDAIEDTWVVLMDQVLVKAINSIQPSCAVKNEWLLQNHIRHLQYRINMLLSADAEARYLEFIRLYPNLTLRVPQWMIASYLGMTAESLSRVRKGLATKNFRPKKY